MSRKQTFRIILSLGAVAVLAVALWTNLNTSRPVQAADVRIIQSVVAPAAVGFADGKTGTLKGKITFKGTVPKLPLLHKAGDPNVKDSPICAAVDMPNETLLVNEKEGNGVANVCIYLQKAPDGYKATPAKESLVFDQKGCHFLPHAMVVRVNQKVLVKSMDSVAHNTHTAPVRAKEFNQAIAPNDRTGVPLTYDKPERVPVAVRCDLHPFMKAYHCVQDHPFMAFTNEKGEFEIKDLPAGKHVFTIWHEVPGYLEKAQTVTITAGKDEKLDLSFGADKFKSK